MKKSWTEEELLENYMPLPNERHLLLSKKTKINADKKDKRDWKYPAKMK